MILPETYLQCLLLLILGTLCLGSWAAIYRSGGKWRFELYYLDYAFGAGLAAVIYGLTSGNLGFDGFSLVDDIMHAGKRQWLFAFVAGITFNLANMLIVGAIAVAGMAVAMTLGAGLGILLGIGVSQLTRTGTNHITMGGSLFLMFAAIVALALAYTMLVADRRAVATEEKQTGGKRRRQPGPIKGILVSLIGGLLMAASYPLFGRSQGGEIGLGPYGAVLLFVLGLVTSTFVLSIFFMNLPLQGEPLELIDYFRVSIKKHLLGVVSGLVWCSGFLAGFLALSAPLEAQPSRFITYAFFQGAPLIGAIWGLVVFREFRMSSRGSVYAGLGIVLSICSLGLALLSSSKM